jgi:hypothetical protein
MTGCWSCRYRGTPAPRDGDTTYGVEQGKDSPDDPALQRTRTDTALAMSNAQSTLASGRIRRQPVAQAASYDQ